MVLNITEESNKEIDHCISKVDTTAGESFWCSED